MGTYYRDAQHLYEIYGYFMERVLSDEKIGPKMAKAGIIIRLSTPTRSPKSPSI